MPLLEIHNRCLTTAAEITSCLMPKAILLMDVIRVLNRAQILFVLVGAYGLAGWLKTPLTGRSSTMPLQSRQAVRNTGFLPWRWPLL